MVELNFTMLAQVLSFLFLFYALKKILYEPLLKFLDERSDQIKNNIDESEKKLAEADELKSEYEKKLKEFSIEMDNLRIDAKAEMQKEKSEVIKEAKLQGEKIIDGAKESIGSEIKKAKKELMKDLADYSVQISAKILKREVSEKDNENIVNRFIETLGEN